MIGISDATNRQSIIVAAVELGGEKTPPQNFLMPAQPDGSTRVEDWCGLPVALLVFDEKR